MGGQEHQTEVRRLIPEARSEQRLALDRAARRAGVVLVSSRTGLVIRLDDGQSVNLLSARRLSALIDLLRRLAELPRRPSWLAIEGNSRGSFAAGADLREIAALDPHRALALSRLGESLMRTLWCGPWASAAVVNGHAHGGGFDLAIACDLVVAVETARFRHPGVRHGFFTGWGGTHRLPRASRRAAAWATLLTGEELTARDALDAGLVARVASASTARRVAIGLLETIAAWHPADLDGWRAARRCAPERGLASALARLSRTGTDSR